MGRSQIDKQAPQRPAFRSSAMSMRPIAAGKAAEAVAAGLGTEGAQKRSDAGLRSVIFPCRRHAPKDRWTTLHDLAPSFVVCLLCHSSFATLILSCTQIVACRRITQTPCQAELVDLCLVQRLRDDGELAAGPLLWLPEAAACRLATRVQQEASAQHSLPQQQRRPSALR